jgi:type II secretory ATPase GspE/PulE/Tfp pilus assembly ATPase PilB-like protein
LIDLGIQPEVLAGNIIGIIAQRLIRTLCTACKTPHTPSPIERQLLKLAPGESASVYKAVGCPTCEHQGYKGRMSIMELLKFDADLDELVTQRASLKSMGVTASVALFPWQKMACAGCAKASPRLRKWAAWWT